jgi:hypothetical protein
MTLGEPISRYLRQPLIFYREGKAYAVVMIYTLDVYNVTVEESPDTCRCETIESDGQPVRRSGR